MKRRPAVARLALLLTLLTVGALAAQAQQTNLLFLPLVENGRPTGSPATPTGGATTATPTRTVTTTSSPTVTPTGTSSPTVTPTGTSQPSGVDVSGSVRLRPEVVFYENLYRPARYMVVLDVSGSQNMTFDGIGTEPGTGRDIQCTNGPNGERNLNCGRPEYAYRDVTQRRIYVQKQAVELLINLLNMPGNTGYDPTRPKDQLALVWYNQESRANWVTDFTSDPQTLKAALAGAGSVGGDPYKTQGGTNWAAGLYRAAQLIEAAPAGTFELGREFDYDEQVVFFTDGVSNNFLDPTAAGLWGGVSDQNTYPAESRCRMLGSAVIEDAQCQTTVGGGTYQGRDRPITQAVSVARQQIQSIPGRPVRVTVVAISNIPATGLEEGVASSGASFFPASRLEVISGETNVNKIIRLIAALTEQIGCQPETAGDWVTVMAEANIPITDLVRPPQVGELFLRSTTTDAQYEAPILRDAATGRLSFQLADVPPGSYSLSAYILYRGSDGSSRVYSRIYEGERSFSEITVSLAGSAQDLGAISLLLSGNVCASQE